MNFLRMFTPSEDGTLAHFKDKTRNYTLVIKKVAPEQLGSAIPYDIAYFIRPDNEKATAEFSRLYKAKNGGAEPAWNSKKEAYIYQHPAAPDVAQNEIQKVLDALTEFDIAFSDTQTAKVILDLCRKIQKECAPSRGR